ncbi:MAG: hypothetical protein E6230_01655 [Paenibacillus dendritiformis]|uniref:hypothetical protein n=1 Tax=Paenibacillus dendritiformis TaxID=130049 RepID=UPI00143DD7F5|nr:hypothetical protein [Paenibacillus dendritiformis]MDU5140875.1 hypothetical protein [Paenibacillus dendritiformis]NKI21848.1 hypothetical protein [Paenibacillus dendritiformis]NRF97340.1 hypothetical protein [Paenibacillus dendritiformis]GIO71526.1 hypothetical protein J27TS7_10400 [Paenibacillus dendritiformis]
MRTAFGGERSCVVAGELRLVLLMRSRHHKKPPDTYGFAMPFLSCSREGTAIFIVLFEEEYGC